MEVSWINVIDTAVKIGLGAIIAAISGHVGLLKNQKYDDKKFDRDQFYRLQEEKKLKYVELLALSQELIQSHLYSSSAPDTEELRRYLRVFNEVQIISNDSIRLAAFQLCNSVEQFVYLRKEQQEYSLIDDMRDNARKQISGFQIVAQIEVTKKYVAP